MYVGLLHSHSYLAYLVLAGLLISFVVALAGWLGNKTFTDKDRKMGLLGLIPAHLQWVIGIVLYFVSPNGISRATEGFMKDSGSRLYVLEHPLMMIIAVVLITIGYSKAKRQLNSGNGFKTMAIFYGLALVLILSRIPWISWPGN